MQSNLWTIEYIEPYINQYGRVRHIGDKAVVTPERARKLIAEQIAVLTDINIQEIALKELQTMRGVQMEALSEEPAPSLFTKLKKFLKRITPTIKITK